MRRPFSIVVFAAVLAAHVVSTAAEPTRVISLKPNITDIVVALGATKKLVGVTRYCDLPQGTQRPTIIGDYARAHSERIIALAPDMVLASKENASRRSIDMLKSLNIPVRLFSFRTMEDILTSIHEIADALGISEAGKHLEQQTREQLAELSRTWKKKDPVRVLLIWGTRPIIVGGRGTYIDEQLTTIGAINAIEHGSTAYPRIGLEELIAMDPDAIIDLSMGSEVKSDANARPWTHLEALRAVREGHLHAMNATLLRPGPNLPKGLARMAQLIHGKKRTRLNSPPPL